MNRQQIEAWALRTVRAVEEGSGIEDSSVELKSEWPTDHARTAKQLAAHANAASEQFVLWLIGADETAGVVAFNDVEVSSWWTSIERWFDPPAPTLHNVVTFINGKRVVALVFDVSARPFVTTNPDGGAIPFLVPWREGNRTRTANRSELLSIVLPLEATPEFEILQLEARANPSVDQQDQQWWINLDAYVHQDAGRTMVIPLHRCNATLEVPEFSLLVDLTDPSFMDPGTGSGRPIGDGIVDGPGRLSFRADGSLPFNAGMALPAIRPEEPVQVTVTFKPANVDRAILIRRSLAYSDDPNYWGSWSLTPS